ncbi:MAG: ferrous iron transport protein A [Helicobacter sp.]|uniref:FeoA family protein n=1 Tax=Helicobacter sp. TaxID=218 RepID=UPI0025B96DA9|nr:FeoA family protein [Helicobacter sp.]MCH5312799.1 ferrous iron transport protein A [Helicobacter sp.]
MTLYECALGAKCKIISCEAKDEALCDRLMSFGIVKDKICQVVNHSFRRLAVVILIEGTQVALRDSEAKMIIVEVLENKAS